MAVVRRGLVGAWGRNGAPTLLRSDLLREGNFSTAFGRHLSTKTGPQKKFRSLMCCNRGEIAIRVFRGATELGLRTVRDLALIDLYLLLASVQGQKPGSDINFARIRGPYQVGVYAREDRLSLHRYKCDESYQIGEHTTPVGAYLDIDSIVKLAKAKDVDAIHPGYVMIHRQCGELAQTDNSVPTF